MVRYKGRSEVIAVWPNIAKAISDGIPILHIFEDLSSREAISLSQRQFYRHVSKLRAEARPCARHPSLPKKTTKLRPAEQSAGGIPTFTYDPTQKDEVEF